MRRNFKLRILHTADLHLRRNDSYRWKALLEILSVAKNEDIDLLVITGDLFDSSSEASYLHQDLRSLFSGNDFYVLISQGNHDYLVYREGYYLGEDVRIMDSLEHPILINNEQVAIWSLPYQHQSELDVVTKIHNISQQVDENMYNLLLFHGELLETYYSGEDFGDEGDSTYMPVKKSNLAENKFDYILAGHFHTDYKVYNLHNKSNTGGYFIYPGSPVAITSKELGKRKADLIELGLPPKEIILNTKHYLHKRIELNPLLENHPIKQVEKFLSVQDMDKSTHLLLQVSGYINGEYWGETERTIVQKIEQQCKYLLDKDQIADYTLTVDFQDLGVILNDELYKQIRKKIKTLFPGT